MSAVWPKFYPALNHQFNCHFWDALIIAWTLIYFPDIQNSSTLAHRHDSNLWNETAKSDYDTLFSSSLYPVCCCCGFISSDTALNNDNNSMLADTIFHLLFSSFFFSFCKWRRFLILKNDVSNLPDIFPIKVSTVVAVGNIVASFYCCINDMNWCSSFIAYRIKIIYYLLRFQGFCFEKIWLLNVRNGRWEIRFMYDQGPFHFKSIRPFQKI